jgi:hypothetical protein
MQAVQAQTDQDQARVKAFCASPDFRKLSCGFAGAAEQKLKSDSCWRCGDGYRRLQGSLPAEVEGIPDDDQFIVEPLSLACNGPVVVRTVFKMLSEAPVDNMARGLQGTDCTPFRLINKGENDATPNVVRCELELPPSGGSEAERALRAKEGRCWMCGLCVKGFGCPSTKGKWYSDSYTTVAACCSSVDPRWWYPESAEINIFPKPTKVLLAKFEVCSPGSCFDPAYEQQKRQSARQCVKGLCA